jgi:hypothetical protein
MSQTQDRVFLIPVLMRVRGECMDDAKRKAIDALTCMGEVSNDEGDVRSVAVFNGKADVAAPGLPAFDDDVPEFAEERGTLRVVMFQGALGLDDARCALQCDVAPEALRTSEADELIADFSKHMGSGGNEDEPEGEFDTFLLQRGLYPLGVTQVDSHTAWNEP